MLLILVLSQWGRGVSAPRTPSQPAAPEADTGLHPCVPCAHTHCRGRDSQSTRSRFISEGI